MKLSFYMMPLREPMENPAAAGEQSRF